MTPKCFTKAGITYRRPDGKKVPDKSYISDGYVSDVSDGVKEAHIGYSNSTA